MKCGWRARDTDSQCRHEATTVIHAVCSRELVTAMPSCHEHTKTALRYHSTGDLICKEHMAVEKHAVKLTQLELLDSRFVYGFAGDILHTYAQEQS